jgi:hypothetical protein
MGRGSGQACSAAPAIRMRSVVFGFDLSPPFLERSHVPKRLTASAATPLA